MENLALFRRDMLLSAASFSPSCFKAALAFSSSVLCFFGATLPIEKIEGGLPQFLFLTNSDLVFAPLWEKFFYVSCSLEHKPHGRRASTPCRGPH